MKSLHRAHPGCVLLVLLAISLNLAAQGSDAHFGTWKLNIAKSTRDAAAAPQNQISIRKYEAFEGAGSG